MFNFTQLNSLNKSDFDAMNIAIMYGHFDIYNYLTKNYVINIFNCISYLYDIRNMPTYHIFRYYSIYESNFDMLVEIMSAQLDSKSTDMLIDTYALTFMSFGKYIELLEMAVDLNDSLFID